jgi:Fur family ferric uptake transcriptional regulator
VPAEIGHACQPGRARALAGTASTLYRAFVTTQPGDRAPAGAQGPVRGTRVRGTRQAQALAAALDSLPGFCSAQEIHAELRRKGEHVGLTTVYRHLQSLSEQGRIDAIRDDSGEILYRQCGTSVHHHHLTCRNCGKSVEVEGRAVEQWAERVAAEAGFTDVGHTVELFGMCPECADQGQQFRGLWHPKPPTYRGELGPAAGDRLNDSSGEQHQ